MHSSLEQEVLRFKSLVGQIRRSVATTATFLQRELCCPSAMIRRRALSTRYMLWRISASVMKDLIGEPPAHKVS